MSEKRVAPPDGGSGDLVLIQRHLENLSAGEILEELDARMEEMTDQSCDPELIRLYLDVLEEKEPLGLELDPEASLQRFLEERAGEESRSTPPEEPAAQAAVSRPAGLRRFRHFPRTLIAAAVVAVLFGLGSMAGSSRLWESVVHLTQGTLQIVPPGASQSGQTSAQPPLEELEFTSLQEALDAYGITEPLVPKWLPEGFESRDVIISVDPDFIRIIAVYQYGEKEIKVTVRRYNSEDALERFSLEKQEGQQDTKYTKDTLKMVWCTQLRKIMRLARHRGLMGLIWHLLWEM